MDILSHNKQILNYKKLLFYTFLIIYRHFEAKKLRLPTIVNEAA